MKLSKEDIQLIDCARKSINSKNNQRWKCLLIATVFLFLSGWFTWKLLSKLDNLPLKEITEGFTVGAFISLIVMSFGAVGGLYLAKFIVGISDFKMEELLLKYYDENQKND